MTRAAWAVAAALALLASTGCRRGGAPAGQAAFRPAQVGDLLPDFVMPSLAGDTIRVTPGQPVTLVNVWATWCTSCREEMANLVAMQRDFGPRGLRVVAVSVDQSDDARVQRFVAEEHIPLTVVHDQGGTIESLYNVVGVPTTYLVGSNGALLWSHAGNIAAVMPALRAAADTALGRASR